LFDAFFPALIGDRTDRARPRRDDVFVIDGTATLMKPGPAKRMAKRSMGLFGNFFDTAADTQFALIQINNREAGVLYRSIHERARPGSELQ
jgi:hypothetical protein